MQFIEVRVFSVKPVISARYDYKNDWMKNISHNCMK
jgi:hypothetical protein